MASGETADVLSDYKNRAEEKADRGEFMPWQTVNHGNS